MRKEAYRTPPLASRLPHGYRPVSMSRSARTRSGLMRALVALVALAACSCASVEFHRDTETSGTFVSTGWAFTFFSHDIPASALNIARENASDARQPNMVV